MTSIIKFTVLSGAKNESPPCYLLQVDNFRFLLDCGWDESFSMKIIDNIKKYAVHYLERMLVCVVHHFLFRTTRLYYYRWLYKNFLHVGGQSVSLAGYSQGAMGWVCTLHNLS